MDCKQRAAVESACDKVIFLALCALICFIPISIGFVNSFAGLAIFCYFIKRVSRITFDWKDKVQHLKFSNKILFIIKAIGPVSSPLNRSIEILALAVLISLLQSQYFSLSLYAFVGKFLKGVFLYFCLIEAINNKKRIWSFVVVFLIAAFLVALSGIIQRFLGVDFLRGHQYVSGDRINACFYSANGLGAYLVPVIAIVCHLLFSVFGRGRSQLIQVGLAILLGLLLICLCWTYSRASWMGFLLSLLFMAFMDKRKIIYALVFLLIFIFFFLPSLNHMRHMSLIKDDLNTSWDLSLGGSGRIGFWKDAIIVINKYPLWGGGLNTYSRVLKRESLDWHWYAHNSYLQMAAETGLVGLGCFLWMLWNLFYQGFIFLKIKVADMWLKVLLQGQLAGLFGFLVSCLFDNTLFTVQLGVLFWIMIGFSMAIIHSNLNLHRGTSDKVYLSKE